MNFFRGRFKFLFRKSFTFVMPFYAVAVGRTVGIFNSWSECEMQVKGYPKAKYKKFNSNDEAKSFITNNMSNISSAPSNSFKNYSTQSISESSKFTSTRCVSKVKAPSDDVLTNANENQKVFHLQNKYDDDLAKLMDRIENKKKATKRTILIEDENLTTKKSRTKDTPNDTFTVNDLGFVVVYTDGACSKNGTLSAKAGLGVYFGENHPLNISEPVSGRATNNCGEIQAATRAIQIAHSNGVKKLLIKTDSKFLIKSITEWIYSWKRNNWKLATGGPVKNEIDFKDLDRVTKLLEVKWEYVEAHKGIIGNERADQLAREGAAKYKSI